MLATILPNHGRDDAAKSTWPRCDVDVESCWQQCCRVMLTMALQLKVVLVVVRLCSPELRASRCCHILKKSDIRVIAGKYHSLRTSPYGKNLTILNVTNKGFAHRLDKT
jgi:hypothetical protein